MEGDEKFNVQRQIGNAVPSLMGETLGREIRRQLLGDRIRSGKLKLAVMRRPNMPRAERVSAVPKKYRLLAGNHTPHPGTGKGYAVRRRK